MLATKAPWREFPELADKELHDLVEKHKEALPDGIHLVGMPFAFDDPTKHAWVDAMVCHRRVLSELGKQTIQLE